MSATAAPHRIRVKYGEAEFDAEGAEDTVKSQYKEFMEFLASAPKLIATAARDQEEDDDEGDGAVVSKRQSDLLKRAFRTEGNDVSLRVLPPGNGDGNRDADALVVLLYGFLRLNSQQEVSAMALMAAARQSGLQRERLDRVVPADFVNRGGHRKGVRYSLNNRGIARAEELLERMFD
jgi:hypothetical protein